MKTSKKCPNCGWKFPILYPPAKRVNGNSFECPSCNKMLKYHSGIGDYSKVLTAIIVAATIPFIFLLASLDENIGVQITIFAVIAPLAIIAFMYFIGIEYIESYDPDSQPSKNSES